MGRALRMVLMALIASGTQMLAEDKKTSTIEALEWGSDPVWKEAWPAPPKKLPEDSRIRRLLSTTIPFQRIDVPQKQCDREIEYTQYWLAALIPKWINSDTFSKPQCAKVFQDDDGVLVEARFNRMHIRAIDSRSLDAVFEGSVIGKRSIIENLKDITSNVFPWRDPSTKLKDLESVDCGDGAEFKRIAVEMSRPGPARPIEVFQNGSVFIISFEKVLTAKEQKIPVQPDQAIGGIPLSDKRQWLRFDSSNREQLSAEYFEKLKGELVQRTKAPPKKPGELTNAPEKKPD